MELTIFGINILLIMAIWRFMLRKTILDHARDKLFDLRSELRSTFIANGWDLGSPAYKRLRDLVNGHLRYTEELAISKAIFFAAAVKEDKTLQDFMHARIAGVFASADAKQHACISDFRQKSLKVALDYSVYSSGYLLILSLLMTPFFACGMAFNLINKQVDITANKCLLYFRNLGRYSGSIMAASAASVAKMVLLPDAVEAYSYRKGIAAA